MKCWLIYDREGAARNKDYIEYHRELGMRYGVDVELILSEDCDDIFFDTRLSVEVPEFVMVRTIDPELSYSLTKRGLNVYNPYRVSYIANHKGRCMKYIENNTDVRTIPTESITADEYYFLGDDEIIRFLSDRDGYVVKSASGHGGNTVRRIRVGEDVDYELDGGMYIRNIDEYRDYIDALNGDDMVIQSYIDGNCEDVRVYVIGTDIVASVRRKAPEGDFRANYSIGGSVKWYDLSDAETIQVKKIIDAFDGEFGMVGIDFIVDDEGRFIFSEIEDVVGARMLYKCCPDIDILDRYFRFVTR